MICRIDGMKYDIYEGKDYLKYFKTETKLAPRCFANFKSNETLGYADVLYYEISVLSGLKHSIQDYKYKDKIYITVTERYKDSNGKEYIVQKKINVGAYIQYKNTKFTMAHLTHGNAGQLVSVEGVVFNNSDFVITIKDLKLYKSMTYANAGVVGDDNKQEIEVQAGTHTDTVGGERTDKFEVWGSLAYTYSHTPNYEYLYKEGNQEWWSTADYWKVWIRGLTWNANGTVEGSRITNEIYTDKYQLCALNDDGTFNIPAYTEYLYIKSKDQDGYNYEHIIYMNSLDLYYGGTDEKYHRKLIDCEKTGRVYYDESGTTKYTEYFVSDATHNELGELESPYTPFEGTFNKYENENFDGVCTLQLKITPDKEDEEVEYKDIYFSNQPFKMMLITNDDETTGSKLVSSVPVYLGDVAGAEYLFWVIPKYFNSAVGFTCVKTISSTTYNANSTYPPDVAKLYFANDMHALDKFEYPAIEDR